MNFSLSTYSQLKRKLRSRYKIILKRINKRLKNHPGRKISQWVFNHTNELEPFSEINWLLLSQINEFLFLIEQEKGLGKEGFGEKEEIVFEKWNNSEFAKDFLNRLNKGDHLGKASTATAKKFDSHLVTLANRHILKSKKTSKYYRLQTSLGERQKDKNLFSLLETTLHLNGVDLKLKTSTLKEMKTFSARIEGALILIKKYSPTSWERFTLFTNTIIPIKEKQFVSYSHQDLPGYSMINMYHRDFIDLMDDLIHENGHHHLNYYLNLDHLIEEPVDAIYYSPWRRTLRPLRGIYHAYFTFFWALKLFSDVLKNIDYKNQTDFTKEELDKINFRAIEEFYMLNYTFQDLVWAKKNKLISPKGWELIEEQQKELKKIKKLIPIWKNNLKFHKKELTGLKKTLEQSALIYAKN